MLLSIGEEIKKEIVSSRCFKLPFITTHKPDLGREVLPAAILFHPPVGWVAGRSRRRQSREQSLYHRLLLSIPARILQPPSTPHPAFFQHLFFRLLFLTGTISLCSYAILYFLPQGSYISVPRVGLKPSVMIITSGIVTSEPGELALRLQEMATDNAVIAIFIL